MNITSDNSIVHLSENSRLKALINTVNFLGTLNQRADAVIEGACNEATLELDNYSSFSGKNFTVNSCDIVCNIGSDAQLEVMENINIEAS